MDVAIAGSIRLTRRVGKLFTLRTVVTAALASLSLIALGLAAAAPFAMP
jgi:hypothetical protein